MGVKVGYRSPPSNSPDFYSSNVIVVVGVVGVVLTRRRESADFIGLVVRIICVASFLSYIFQTTKQHFII